MAAEGRLAATRRLGRMIVSGMPHVLKILVVVGTAAMIWVGGSIIVHGAYELGFKAPYQAIHAVAVAAAHAVPPGLEKIVEWLVTAVIDGVIGLAIGFALIPLVARVIAPLAGAFSRNRETHG